jgi:predicted dithiol-disulfide oxidoreductase (DUF899 family)
MDARTRPVVSPAEWEAALADLRIMEKSATRVQDAIAAERRRMPMVAFAPAAYRFVGPPGERHDLAGLFEGRAQLIVYHFMFDPGAAPCVGCSSFVDSVGHLAHLHARDTTFALVSRAPQDELLPFRARMGWDDIPWYTALDERFQADCGIRGGFGLSVFLQEDGEVFRTYFTSGRGVEGIGSVWALLDRTPYGRQEDWEQSPPGTPQGPAYAWWRLHDEYA